MQLQSYSHGGSAPTSGIQAGAKAWGISTTWKSFWPLQTVAIFVEELTLDANQSLSKELSTAKALALVEHTPAALKGTEVTLHSV